MVKRRKSESMGDAKMDEVSSSGAAARKGSGKPDKQKKGKGTGKGGVLTSSSMSTTLPWSPILAGKAGSVPIVFTPDSAFFFVASASAIRIYATTSGTLVSTLSSTSGASSSPSFGHTATVTGLCLNPNNVAQLISSSLDGTIKVWDYFDGKLLRSVSLGFPITQMCAHPTRKDTVLVALRKARGKEGKAAKANQLTYKGPTNAIVQLVSLKGGRHARERVGKTRYVSHLALSSDGRFAVIVGRQKIYIASLDNKDAGLQKILTDVDITRVAFHPHTNTFATGHENGQIRIWYFLNDEKLALNMAGIYSSSSSSSSSKALQFAPNTMLHWHAHAVSALRFSENGALLLSGGEESTLVVWQLATQGREYVPRLGGSAIMSISIGSEGQGEVVAAMQDGSVAFINTVNLKVTRQLPGVLANSSLQRTLISARAAQHVPFALEPETRHLVTMSGHPSSLQFLAVGSNDAQTMELEVVPSNRISRPEELPLEQARVEHVSFSSTQQRQWMATVDRRASGEVSLKIWLWDDRRKTYMVNTRIEEPHGQGKHVKAIAFSPSSYASIGQRGSPLLVTLGSDNVCRAWRMAVQESENGQPVTYWTARSTFDYRKLAMHGLAFSKDGSLLAVAHSSFASLWDPEANEMLLVTPPVDGVADEEDGECQLLFVGKGAGRFLATATASTFSLFDIVRGSNVYCVPMACEVVGLIEHSSNVVVVVTSNASTSTVSVFSTQSHSAQKDEQLPFAVQKVIGGADGSSDLFVMTSHFDVVRVSVSIDDDDSLDAVAKTLAVQRGKQANALHRLRDVARKRTVYDELLGPQEERQEVEASLLSIASLADAKEPSAASDVSQLFDMPSHLLPPASALFEPFIAHMLPPRRKEEERMGLAKIANEKEADVEVEREAEADTSASMVTAADETTADRMTRIASIDLSPMVEMFASMSADERNGQTKAEQAVLTNGKAAKADMVPAVGLDVRKSPVQSGKKKQQPSLNGGSLNSRESLTTSSSSSKSGRKRKNSGDSSTTRL